MNEKELKTEVAKKYDSASINTFIFAIGITLVFVLLLLIKPQPANAAKSTSRIKDVVSFEGVRDNMLIGYGLVVGLNGTGDKLNNTAFTEQSLVSFLERLGINSKGTKLKTKNVAAVTVTASLPPFSRNGSRINVSVSTIGDAKSLQGGTLLATPLMGADGQVYAVGQGSILTEGFQAAGAGASISKGVPTNGFIPNGAIVEKEIAFDMNNLDEVKLALRNPDVTTATGISAAINSKLGQPAAFVSDPGTVKVTVPQNYKNAVVTLLQDIEQIPVTTDQPARIVIDEASGTIVMGDNVRIDTVAIAQGNLVVKITEGAEVSQADPFAPEGAQTVITPVTEITVTEDKDKKIAIMKRGANLSELVNGLNSLGVGPRDLISILQTIKAAGAIHADIETR